MWDVLFLVSCFERKFLDSRKGFEQVCVHLEKANRFRFTWFRLISYSHLRSEILFLIMSLNSLNEVRLVFLTATLRRWTPGYLDSGD